MDFREMVASDRRYVVPTWALGARWRGLSRRERFARVDRMIDEEHARVVVLAHDLTVHAWAAGAAGQLHYVYVPPELRGEGLARRVITHLLGAYPEIIHVTHPWPRASERFREARGRPRIAA